MRFNTLFSTKEPTAITQVHGQIQGLKSSQLKRLNRFHQRRVPPERVIGPVVHAPDKLLYLRGLHGVAPGPDSAHKNEHLHRVGEGCRLFVGDGGDDADVGDVLGEERRRKGYRG